MSSINQSAIQGSSIKGSVIDGASKDVIKIDSKRTFFETYDQEKEILNFIASKNARLFEIQEFPDSFVVREKSDEYWYVITQIEDRPNYYNVSMYTNKKDYRIKYLKRQLDDFIFIIDFIQNPEDFLEDDPEK